MVVDNALLLSLSKQMVMRRTMDIIANNLANMNTTGFKRESALFEEYLVPFETETADGPKTENLSFVRDYGIVRDMTVGHLETTSNPLDLAIEGQGYFSVETPEGVRYTRNGHFIRDAEGRIAMTGGALLLDDSGQPISLAEGENDIKVAEDGTISTEQGVKGRIAVVKFANMQDMNKIGESLYETTQTPEPSDKVSIMQGMLETSNVEPIIEMTNMIEALRSYQKIGRAHV
jgi:flagellar basal-body rod protein FlgF